MTESPRPALPEHLIAGFREVPPATLADLVGLDAAGIAAKVAERDG